MTIEPGIYRNWKGGLYEVLCMAADSEHISLHDRHPEEVVVYRSLDDGRWWFRTPERFCEPVRIIREDGKTHEVHASRFTRVDDVLLTVDDLPRDDINLGHAVVATKPFTLVGFLHFLVGLGWDSQGEKYRRVRAALAETAARKKGAGKP